MTSTATTTRPTITAAEIDARISAAGKRIAAARHAQAARIQLDAAAAQLTEAARAAYADSQHSRYLILCEARSAVTRAQLDLDALDYASAARNCDLAVAAARATNADVVALILAKREALRAAY